MITNIKVYLITFFYDIFISLLIKSDILLQCSSKGDFILNKTLIGLGTLFSAISLGFNGNYSSANTQTTNASNTPNVRVLNNNTVSPTSSAPKSINSVNTQSNLQSNVNVKENSNSASNIYKKNHQNRVVLLRQQFRLT